MKIEEEIQHLIEFFENEIDRIPWHMPTSTPGVSIKLIEAKAAILMAIRRLSDAKILEEKQNEGPDKELPVS